MQLKERPFLEVCEVAFAKQLARGQHAFAENPWASMAWAEKPIRRVINMPNVQSVKVDMCQFGLRHPRTGLPIRKATRLLVTTQHEVLLYAMGQSTCTRSWSLRAGSGFAAPR